MNLNLFKINQNWIILAALVMATGALRAEVAVIANKDVGVDSITAKEAKKIWLGKTKTLGGTKIKPSDLPIGNASREFFYSKVVKKNEKKLKAYWAKIVFAGKGLPPKELASDAEVLSWVAKTPGAVGYVDGAAADSTVKVLMISQ